MLYEEEIRMPQEFTYLESCPRYLPRYELILEEWKEQEWEE